VRARQDWRGNLYLNADVGSAFQENAQLRQSLPGYTPLNCTFTLVSVLTLIVGYNLTARGCGAGNRLHLEFHGRSKWGSAYSYSQSIESIPVHSGKYSSIRCQQKPRGLLGLGLAPAE